MWMKNEYIYLTIIILGPRNPKDRLEVYLQPLIEELKYLESRLMMHIEKLKRWKKLCKILGEEVEDR